MITPIPSLDAHHKPRLRKFLDAEKDSEGYVLFDPRRVGAAVRLSPFALHVASRFFDGTRTLTEIYSEILTESSGTHITLDTLLGLANGLDQCLLLDGPSLGVVLSSPTRKPSCIGCYDEDPEVLRKQLEALFTGKGGPGLPKVSRSNSRSNSVEKGRLKGVLAPHIDYARGNVSYGWAYKELAERTNARLFVIVGTSHYSPLRFTLTRQHFETPLGVAETDHALVEKLADAYGGDGLFDDEIAHMPEHSIELEVVLLQYLFESRGPIRILPLLVGTYEDCVLERKLPRDAIDIARMIAALQKIEKTTDEPICYIISGDLAHIGPKFGDEKPVDTPALARSRSQDELVMAKASAVDGAGYFNTIAEEGDERRICGLPPTYLALEAAKPTEGRLLNYQQYVHPRGHESVSFASMAFYE